jgi:AraC-like DNA-binding protein
MRVLPRIIFDYELVLIVRGNGEYQVGRDIHTFHVNDILCIPPFMPHAIMQDRQGPCEHIAIHFDFRPDIPPRSDKPPDRKPYVVRLHGNAVLPEFPVRADETVRERLMRILAERNRDDAFSEVAAGAALTDALIHLMRSHSQTTHDAPVTLQQARIDAAIAAIQSRYREPFALNDLAAIADLSASRFSVVFRQLTGCTPMDFLQRTRMAEAKKRLGDVHLSIKEIAACVGYPDALHFSKIFRKTDGLSPTQYREAVLANRTNEDVAR